jgi:predicted esterase
MKFFTHMLRSVIFLTLFTVAHQVYSAEPSWSAGYPVILTGASSADIKAKVTESGTLYYVIFKSAQTAITASQIKSYGLAGGNTQIVRYGSRAITANIEILIKEASMVDNTTYHIYMVSESGGILMNNARISYTSRAFPKRQREFTTYQDNVIAGHLMYLPEPYYKDNNTYPLLVFLHGMGERSNSESPVLSRLTNTGLPMVIKNGKEIPMIVASPQAKYYWDNTQTQIDQFIEHIKATYRVDASQIFISGISMGGSGVFDYVNAYPQKIKAMVPVSTWPAGNVSNFINVPVWGFMGTSDPSNLVQFIAELTLLGGTAKFTQYPGGHVPSVWNAVYSGAYGDDIYTWMLQGGKGSTSVNKPPVANAGQDQEVFEPIDQIQIYGTATDSDGAISSIQWTKISGPEVVLANDKTLTPTLSGLSVGTYTMQLSATDDDGAMTTDRMTLTVNEAPPAVPQGERNFYVNLTWSLNLESGIWNNFVTSNGGTTGSSVNLFDSNKISSSLRLSITSDFQDGANNHGPSSGIFPANVMKYYLRSTQTKKGVLKLSGLDPSKVYDLSFLASNADTWYPSDTRFTVGSTSVVVDGKGNTDQLVDIKQLTPSASGEIVITVAPATTNTSNNGVVNAIVVREYRINAPPTVNAGADQALTLPLTNVTLTGNATDTDGTIASWQWTKISGPTVTMSNTTSSSLTLSNLLAGTYTFELRATDNDGDNSSDQVVVTINEPAPAPAPTVEKTFYVNLTWSMNQEGGVWNNFNTSFGGTAGTAMNLFDSNNASSAVRLSITSDFQDGANNHGVTPGIYPTNVMRYYLRSTQTKKGVLKLSGLDVTKVYDLSFLASNADTWYPSDTKFTIGSRSVTVDAKANSNRLVDLTQVTPSSAGEIIINVAPATTNTANHGVINAIVIKEYSLNALPIVNAGQDQSVSLPLASLVITGAGTDPDGAISEWQWTKVSGPSVTMSNTTTTALTLTNLVAGSYVFELSATDNSGDVSTDEVSLTVSEAPVATKSFYVNLTWTMNQEGGVWNNFNTSFGGTAGTSSALFDSNKNPSAVTLSITSDFQDGANNHGVTPGIYPTNVMRYYLRSTQTKKGVLKFSGLDASKMYDLSFLASNADTWYPSDTKFTIGSRSVTIDAKGNASNLVNIAQVTPSGSGEIIITVAPATLNSSNHGVVNAIILSETSGSSSARMASAKNDADQIKTIAVETTQTLKYFPNPVTDRLTISIDPSLVTGDATIEFYDLKGALLITRSLEFSSQQDATVDTMNLPAGMYHVVLRSANTLQRFRIVKR